MRWKPLRYQMRGMKFLIENPGAALFLEPGLRKTSIALGAIKFLRDKGVLRRALIVAPLRVCHNVWPLEIEKWDDFRDISYTILHGGRKRDLIEEDSDLFIVTPDGIKWIAENNLLRKLKPDTLIIDESTKFKAWRSQRMLTLKQMLPKFKRRWIMSGGPTPNSYIDLFSQMYIVDMGRSLGQYITHYRNAFFDPVGEYGWELAEGSDKTIEKRIKSVVFSIPAKDYIKLPKNIIDPVFVDLPTKPRAIYEKMEEELFAEINRNNVIRAVNQGVASMKCRQIASGAIYREKDILKPEQKIPRGSWKRIHAEKEEALLELLEEIKTPVLILYYFKHELERLRKVLGKKTPCLSDCTMNELKQITKDWNASRLPILLGHPDSMGHGLNLQEGKAQHIIFFALTWNYDSYDQTMRRLIRSGSPHSKIITHIIMARNTVDQIMYASLNCKGTRQTRLMNAITTYRKRKQK